MPILEKVQWVSEYSGGSNTKHIQIADGGWLSVFGWHSGFEWSAIFPIDGGHLPKNGGLVFGMVAMP